MLKAILVLLVSTVYIHAQDVEDLEVGPSTPSYLITAPNRFIPGRAEKICIELFNVTEDIVLSFNLSEFWEYSTWRELPEGAENMTVASEEVTISPEDVELGGNTCIELTYSQNYSMATEVRDRDPDYLILSVRGQAQSSKDGDGWNFEDEMKISLLNRWYNSEMTFINTDKPIYKPGQLVQFRVLTLDTQLLPSTQMIDEIYITTPKNIRVEQWNNVSMDQGLGTFKFQLPEEPEFGDYKISVKPQGLNSRETEQSFTVEEYVLPKYEVVVEPPQYITFQTESVTAQVCAKYTYGKPVKGTVEATVCVKQFRWFIEPRRLNPVIDDTDGNTNSTNTTTPAGADGGESGGQDASSSDLILPPKEDSGTEDGTYCTIIQKQLENGCYTLNISKSDAGWDRYDKFEWGVSLEIDAKVKEEGSGNVINATTVSLPFQQHDIKVEMRGPDRYKPGLPYNGLVKVTKLDGTPVENETISIEIGSWGPYEQYAKNYSTDMDGEIKFSIPPVAGDIPNFSIQANAVNYNSHFWNGRTPTSSLYVRGWYSPSGSFLQISPKTEKLECGSMETFSIQYTTNISYDTVLMYKVVGPGNIADEGYIPINLTTNTTVDEPLDDNWDVTEKDSCFYRWWSCYPLVRNETSTTTADPRQSNETEPEDETIQQNVAEYKGSFDLEINITSGLSPSAMLVVYYVRPDGEVVADGISLDIQECTNNNVNMNFSVEQAAPKEQVNITFQASPGSLCSYGIVDKSVHLKGGNNQLSLSGALQRIRNIALSQYSGVYEYDEMRCDALNNYTAEQRLNESFYWDTPYDDASIGLQKGGLAYMSNLKIKTTPCLKRYFRVMLFAQDGAPAMRMASGGAPEAERNEKTSGDSEDAVTKTIRTYFPETWLWDLVTIDDEGEASVEATVPDTITQWVGNAVCLSDQDGLGVSDTVTLTAFQPFFVSMNLPYSVIREEQVPIAVTVSNYESDCMAVNISMNQEPGYTILNKPWGVDCVCGQDTVTRQFIVAIRELGDVNISITAEVVEDNSACPSDVNMTDLIGMSDTVIRPVVVDPEGTPREYTVSDFVCITSPEGGDENETQSITLNYDLPLPPYYQRVKDSERAFVKVVGDVMGPAMSNIDQLLQMPYGCAEQTMVSFAPNIFILKYLEAASRDEPEIRQKAIEYMKRGYARELGYAHNDQSYSSFGTTEPEKPGSMWLTAFVVKCFGLADPYIFIDKMVQEKSLKFFTDNQDEEGCFPQIGTVHNKYMQGGNGKNATNKAALTAYVAIAMMESGLVDVENSTELEMAFECIGNQTYEDGYTTAIVAYAYSMYDSNSTESEAVFDQLMQLSTDGEDGMKYWMANQDEPKEPELTYWWYRPNSANTETTAYALLTMLNMIESDQDKISDGLPIVRWLTTQRNPWGGFGSTQDTVIGLQALAEYASLIYNGEGLDAQITISNAESGDEVANFDLNNDNSLVEYSEKLPHVAAISLNANGTGCFLLQANVRYNIEKTDTQEQAFYTSAHVFRRFGSKDPCKMRTMRLCSSYQGEGGVSNMAIISIEMVTGWEADRTSLKGLVKEGKVARFEVDKDGTVQLYFEQLTRNKLCLMFDIDETLEVEETKPALITTYDYYKTELRQEFDYTIWKCSTNFDKLLPA